MAVSQAGAIQNAKAQTTEWLDSVYPKYSLDSQLALAARWLGMNGHGGSLAGQISCRVPHPEKGNQALALRVSKYGYSFEEMGPDSMITTDENLAPLEPASSEDKSFPNYATRFHKHVYAAREDVTCIIHTHPFYCSVLGLLESEQLADHMDMMGVYEDVAFAKDWPGVPFGDEEGEFMVRNMAGKNAIILPNHGMLVVGKTLESALYRAYFLEQAAKLTVTALSAKVALRRPVSPELARIARDWRMNDAPVKAHVAYFFRKVVEELSKERALGNHTSACFLTLLNAEL